MICKKCNEKNLYKAHYCQKCGYAFTDEDREIAYSKTIYGLYNKLEDLYKKLTLDTITGSIYFKVLSIVCVLAVGVYGFLSNGNQMKIMESEQYEVQYNTKTCEYYLLTDLDEISVALYLPKEAEVLRVLEVDSYNQLVNENEYTIEDSIVLEQTNCRYEIEAVYNETSEKMVIRVFGK